MPRPFIPDSALIGSRITLGIDGGGSGAFAWVSQLGVLIDFADMPIVSIQGKKHVSAVQVAEFMRRRSVFEVVIEQPQAMPRKGKDGEETKMGTGSTGAFFYRVGIIEGCAAALGLSYRIIHPRTWKNRANVPADKDAARLMAQRIWPEFVSSFDRKKDNGRADAALFARWAALG